jgi:hypothetical protein
VTTTARLPKMTKSNSLALSAWLDNKSQAFLFGWDIQPSGMSFHHSLPATGGCISAK